MSEQYIDPSTGAHLEPAPKLVIKSARELAEQQWHNRNPNVRLNKIRRILIASGYVDWSFLFAPHPVSSTSVAPVVIARQPETVFLVSCWPGMWDRTSNGVMFMKAGPEIRVWRFPYGDTPDNDCRLGIIKPSLNHDLPSYATSTGEPLDPASSEATIMNRVVMGVAAKQPAIEIIRNCDANHTH